MEKNYLKKSTTIISLICVVAVLASLACQFLSGWEFTGLIKDKKTGEERAVTMETSLASYVWYPYETEALAFEEYLKNPSVTYSEEVTQKDCNEEDVIALDKILNAPKAKKNAFVATTSTPEASDATTTDATTTDATTTDATTTDATTTDATEATDTEAPAPEAVESTIEVDPNATYSGLMVKIAEVPKDPYALKKTVLETINSESANKRYEEFASKISTDSAKHAAYINSTVGFPILLFFASILAIAAIFFALFTNTPFVASGVTVLIGLLNILHLFIQPIYLVCQHSTFVLMFGISAVVTLWGLILLLLDVKSAKKAKAEAK